MIIIGDGKIEIKSDKEILREAERRKKMECYGCVYYYYEKDTNWSQCTHENYDIEKPDHCPGWYSIEDAKADARYSHCDKY